MSIEKIMDSSKEIFKIDKDILSFKIDSREKKSSNESEALSDEEVTITNLTQEYLAFKAQTTKKKSYSVDPPYCIIPPNETKKLKIIFYLIPEEKLESKGHKFKFEGFIISESEKNEEVKDLFANAIKKGNKVIGNIQKRNVKFIFEEKNEDMKMKKEVNNSLKEVNNSFKYLFIGVLLISAVIAFYLFK